MDGDSIVSVYILYNYYYKGRTISYIDTMYQFPPSKKKSRAPISIYP